MIRTAVVLVCAVAAVASAVAWAQAPPAPRPRAPAGHSAEELDCFACHRATHGGVLGLYAGTAGRGVPPAPARMFEVRVQCLACHIAPGGADPAGGAFGQTFRASDAACATCHGDRYRGLIDRWRTTFAAMREAVAPKARAARAAVEAAAPDAKQARARALVDDAEHNLKLVALANGAHNAFYAANLVRRADGWLDEAGALLGQPPAKTADALLRGGYCAALCHEPVGIKTPATATFGGRPFPHGRHVAELGAGCTTCHSGDTHKKLVATPATCSGCHHSGANDRCESCHRDQSAFYRGTVTTSLVRVAPNVMAEAVACTACHDFAHAKSRTAMATACTACHERTYLPLLAEWTTGFARDVAQTSAALRAAETDVARARQAGRKTGEAEALLKEARAAVALVRAGGAAHNPLAADALLSGARERAERARGQVSRR